MTVIGFNFNKILVERLGTNKGKLTISNNVSITDIGEAKVPFGNDKTKCIKIDFKFESKYEPSVANLLFEGDVLYMLPSDMAEKVISTWSEKRTILEDFVQPIMNSILSKANVEALILSRELNLPSPIPLPKVNIKSDPKK